MVIFSQVPDGTEHVHHPPKQISYSGKFISYYVCSLTAIMVPMYHTMYWILYPIQAGAMAATVGRSTRRVRGPGAPHGPKKVLLVDFRNPNRYDVYIHVFIHTLTYVCIYLYTCVYIYKWRMCTYLHKYVYPWSPRARSAQVKV